METKLCSKCKKDKLIKEFAPDKRRICGLQSQCRKCQKRYMGRYTDKYKKRKQVIITRYGIGLGTLRRYGLKLGLVVYDRANRKCQKCEGVNDLTIHHLDRNGRNNEEKGLPVNNDLNNLIVICRKCHGSIHGKESKGISKTSKKEGRVKK